MVDLKSKSEFNVQCENNTSIKQKQLNRPRLGFLHSAWTTSDLLHQDSSFSCISPSSSDHSENDITNSYKIQLSQLHLSAEQDEILIEIRRMIYIADFLCLFESLIEFIIIIYSLPWLVDDWMDWLPYIILPGYTFWWLFMIVILNNKSTPLHLYLNWATASALIMATTNLYLATSLPLPTPVRFSSLIQPGRILLIALSILTTLLFRFANRLLIANQTKTVRLNHTLVNEQARLQYFVDQCTEAFHEHQLAFLTTVSQEIQDVALMVITTLEQFSPTSILSSGTNTTHELLNACSLAVPIASISAIGVMIRQVCHISSHLHLLSALTAQAWSKSRQNNNIQPSLPELKLNEFDIGELLQNVGDALAGVASKLNVKFVIYHYDNSLHHTSVIGDEGAIRHALLNHLRNVLECCAPSTCIEVGLNVTPNRTKREKKCKITFYITHTSSASNTDDPSLLPNANLTAELISYIHATSSIQQINEEKTEFEFSVELDYGAQNEDNRTIFELDDNNKSTTLLKQYYSNIQFSNEPSLKELGEFIKCLKGLKMVLHATEKSIFAKHLTSCLASWNTDISHVPITDQKQSLKKEPKSHAESSNPLLRTAGPIPPTVPTPLIEEEQIHAIPPAFILIDDHLPTLERKLSEFRSQPPASAYVLQQAVHHGRRHKKSSPHNFFHHGSSAIIYFSSLSHYKAVRDLIQCFVLSSSSPHPFSMPRVVVVPKPAGPRRFLTALHTVWHHAVVQPHFCAIATSPLSPIPPILNQIIQNSPRGSPPAPAPEQHFIRREQGNSHYFGVRRRSSQQHDQDYFVITNSGNNSSLMNALSSNTAVMTEETVTNIEKTIAEKVVETGLQTTEAVDNKPSITNTMDEIPVAPKKKTISKMMTNFKLNKKKKKVKGTPFTDVISPPINVLIVEDNIINQAILSTWMKKHQIKFSVASNGKEAMDIQLPVMDGIEATKMIRSIEKEQKIGVLPTSFRQQRGSEESLESSHEEEEDYKISVFRSPVIIVALTASSLESDRHAALAAGCNDFLTKPVSLEWLEKKIIEWGCMQALIDFEGWRRWKKSIHNNSDNKIAKPQQHVTATKKPTEEPKNEQRSTTQQGLLLPGIGHLVKARRSDGNKKMSRSVIALKTSKSDSDTPQCNNNAKLSSDHHHSRLASTSDTTTAISKK
ncbi:uncharacterized protein BX663DRAFT_440604 [Cokeromyces recurvatus]|uniref:uncharacterized protein n=1 Tax=Cokeromyces recurvatus TaxID=90255 RepID=UPI002220DA38|nr:uncharacterized protein BX663DRAFT_440604 [Cokeromyces recurvatus]KAI7899688.1 hypothetical protein BX663DRAFT_440604 [Cokeromyces recurvatus]